MKTAFQQGYEAGWRDDFVPNRDKLGRFASKAGGAASKAAATAKTAGKAAAPAAIAWAASKAVGGAVSSAAASHGIDPRIAGVVAESATKGLVATAARAVKDGLSPKDAAITFVKESALAFAAMAPGLVNATVIGGDPMVAQMVGMSVGGSRNLDKVITQVPNLTQTFNKLLKKRGLRRDAMTLPDLTAEESEALLMLTLIAYGVAAQARQDGRSPFRRGYQEEQCR